MARRLAARLAAAGHAVRWICPLADGEHEVEPAGVDLRPVVSSTPHFTAVEDGLCDVPTERAVSVAVRGRLPAVVHHLAFGGGQSANASWVAERLGARVVVSVDARELLCHRGTLIDQDGQDCDGWRSEERCAACCLTPYSGGLSEREARRAGSWWWRLPGVAGWSPYPVPVTFQNRRDLLLGGLLPASEVWINDEAERARLVAAAVPEQRLRVVDLADPDAALAGYESVVRQSAAMYG
ncbi:MAG: hypothetical protein AAF628_11025 [Planctomycetota bacterium]